MRQKHLEMSKASFMEYINDLKNYAKQHTDKKILLITLGASHGFLT
jgi:prefoldin subunit 5